MPVFVSVEPGAEPVELETVKAHLRVTGNEDNAYIRDLIIAARRVIEIQAQRSLITKTWKLVQDCFPSSRVISLPFGPVQSITSVKYRDAAGVEQTLSSSLYVSDVVSTPSRVILKDGVSWPEVWRDGNAVTVEFVAGYGDQPSAVPGDLKHAIMLLVGHYYENREDIFVGNIDARHLPKAVDYLVMPHRIWT